MININVVFDIIDANGKEFEGCYIYYCEEWYSPYRYPYRTSLTCYVGHQLQIEADLSNYDVTRIYDADTDENMPQDMIDEYLKVIKKSGYPVCTNVEIKRN